MDAVTVGGAFLQLFTNIQKASLGREGNVGYVAAFLTEL
jgi:hypothetical protein